MTGSSVVFDTWAWWEILGDSAKGRRLEEAYLKRSNVHVYTSVISLGELSAKLSAMGRDRQVADVASSIRSHSDLVDVTVELALQAGFLRTRLRKRDDQASLADAIVMATAQRYGALVISEDPAFRDQGKLH